MILLRTTILVFCLSLWGVSLSAQPFFPGQVDSIGGIWVGKLYQEEGGFADEFEFLLEIEVNGHTATGISRVGLDDIQASIAFTAVRLNNGNWEFKEVDIINSREPENIEWCYKMYQLRLGRSTTGTETLTGSWWGSTKSGPCVPGTIVLKKSKTRA